MLFPEWISLISFGEGAANTQPHSDVPRRSTRGRNPLPPTSGPLFPPLAPKPPKQPRNSPKSRPSPSSNSPSVASKLSTSFNGVQLKYEDDAEAEATEDAGEGDEAVPPKESPNTKHNPPSGSGTSLTPPPPTSDAANVDAGEANGEAQEDDGTGETSNSQSGVTGDGSEDWESYRRHRGVRSFGHTQGDVKEEDEGEEAVEDAEETPKKPPPTRTSARRTSHVKEDISEAATSEAGGSGRSRRRRGEEQLLMDDHLLPAELRRTGGLSGRRGQTQSKDLDQPHAEEDMDGPEEVDAGDDTLEPEDEEAEPGQAEGDEEAVPEDGQQDDVTRCVCKRDGESEVSLLGGADAGSDGDPMMIQCDGCNVWQHGPCMGIWADEQAPDGECC